MNRLARLFTVEGFSQIGCVFRNEFNLFVFQRVTFYTKHIYSCVFHTLLISAQQNTGKRMAR